MVIVSTPSNKKRIPAKAVQGERLLNLIFERDMDKGSHFIEISGCQGSGKTSLLIGLATKIMRTNPNEIIVMREPEGNPLQVNKIGDNWRILAEKQHPIKVFDITNEMVDVTDSMPIFYFEGIQHLLKYLHPGIVNVIYFKDLYKWIDLLNALKLLSGWKTCLWDEYEDICPEHSSGKIWKKNKELSGSVKQIRKGRVTLIANSQSNMDVDFRVRSKITIWCYLFGARLDRLSPIVKGAVNRLSVGSGWIDYGHSFYGQFTFPAFKPKEKIYVVMSEHEEEEEDDDELPNFSDNTPVTLA